MPESAEDLKNRLLSRSAEMIKCLADCAVVDDVVTKKVKDCKSPATDAEGKPFMELKYLPKGGIEHPSEYEKRVRLSPFFPETPQILSDRLGALFAEPPQLDGKDKAAYADFQNVATADKKSLLWSLVETARLIQMHGLVAVFVNRSPLPSDVAQRIQDGGKVSQIEKEQRKLGQPLLVIYQAAQILAYKKDERGLVWIKVVEYTNEQTTWDQKPRQVATVRVIDRTQIQSWRIYQDDGGNWHVDAQTAVDHGLLSKDNEPQCPVVLGSAPVGEGQSMMVDSANADIAAFQVLSDIRWSLFMVGQPILAWITNADDGEQGNLAIGVSRYVPLRAGIQGGANPEDLKFVQLDPTGIRLLMEKEADFKRQAKEAAGKAGDAAVTAPVEQSGISRAWQFKTGEERQLFLVTTQLQMLFDSVLDYVAIYMDRDPESIQIKFNTKFDLGAPADTVQTSKDVLDTAEQYGLETAAKVALRRMVAAMGGMSDEEQKASDDEIEQVEVDGTRASLQDALGGAAVGGENGNGVQNQGGNGNRFVQKKPQPSQFQ